jgi:hypothetical protein
MRFILHLLLSRCPSATEGGVPGTESLAENVRDLCGIDVLPSVDLEGRQ